jgi:predicted ATPase
MQKLITQIIIRLVNRNLPVFITTHSDIVFQHINNMIKLFNAKNQKELLKRLNFKQEDMLNPAYIKVYEFVIENNKTIVKPLKLTKQGFEVPTFNNALIELANETMTLSEDVDD